MRTCRFLAIFSLVAAVASAAVVGPAWIRHYNGPTQSKFNEAADSYLDTLTGNFYVVGAGELATNPGGTDLVVVKYRPNGTQAWAKGFSGTGSSTEDIAQAIAVDSVGNVYIAGMTDNPSPQFDDAAWAKYDSNGVELWHRSSNWSNDDIAFDIAIGNAGDVYICGADSGYGYLTGYMVARIDPSDGDTLWKRHYVLDTNALAHRNRGRDLHPDYFDNYDLYDNAAVSIAAAPGGGVVTTGHGLDYNREREWWTMKFGTNGDTSWTKTYRNPASSYDDDDVAFDLAVANNGDIYAVGFDYYELSNSQGYNFAVVRYNSSGTRLNYKSIDMSQEHGDDYAFSVALDDSASQNVYVTGTLCYPAPLMEQVSTMKFDASLTPRWGTAGATFGSTEDDRGYSVFYRKGRIYVAGRKGNDLIVLGYTATNAAFKDTLWTYRYDGSDHMIDFGTTVCASDSDHVFVSGQVTHTEPDVWTSICTARLRYGTPDFAVTSIVAPQGTYDHYDTVIPRAIVRNYGDIIPGFNAYMYIGLPYGDTVLVSDGPEPGQSDTVAFKPWAAHPTGLVVVHCSLETEGDTNPDNDFFTDTVQVIPINVGCRLILSPVGPLDSGTTTMPVARFRNYGTTTQTFPVWFRIETAGRATATGPLLQVYEDADTITLAPQESSDVSFKNWVASPPDTYSMAAFTALYGDDGPANDTVRAQLIVRQPRHDVSATAILAPADTVDSGAVVIPQAAISNLGGARDSFRIRFTIGTFFTSETVMVLLPGNTDTAEFAPWIVNQVGAHTARCSTMLAGDGSPVNDAVQRQVVVKPEPGIASPADVSGVPLEYSLGLPRPNPSVGRTLVPFALPARSRVSLQVYDAVGGLVRTLTSAELPAGYYHALWDGTDERGGKAEHGTYFCRLYTPSYSRITKLIVTD